jgi:hypothetical protein
MPAQLSWEPSNTAARHDPKVIQEVHRAVAEMLSVQGLYNADTVRAREIGRLLGQRQMVAVLEDTLRDEHFARTTFGPRQAEARYFASMALQQAARQGEDAPLLRAVTGIASDPEGELAPGRKQDLEELLLGWARSKDESFFEQAPSSVVSALGYRPDMPDDLRGIYKDAIYMALYRRIGMDRAQTVVDRLFQS